MQTRNAPTTAEDLKAQLMGGAGDPQSAEVTMRGDLQQMSVCDIFQTLVMSKMEGMLRIRNPLEQHLLFFKGGYVQDIIPHRIENRRLGERLIRAGMIDKDQLRGMLDLQQQTGLPLGQLLVREGLISQQHVEDVAYYQAAEDLYSLFTWKDGSFEFFKGPCSDPEHLDLLEVLPRFEGSLILLEVARRSDEWEPILENLHSVDEIIVMLRDPADEKLQDNHLLVLEAVDGHRTIRELAETTLLSLFDCARAVRDLNRWGILGLALPDEILETARSHLDHNKIKRAVAVLRALLLREATIETDTVRELAALLHRCGETSMAGQGLLSAARHCDDPDAALTLVREAHRMDPRSLDALGLLLEHLLIAGDEGTELQEVSCALADALAEQGQNAEALEVIAILETSAPESSAAIIRKARILHKLGRGDEAIEVLLGLAEHHRAEGRHESLATIYEQVLKIDFRRKDIAKALRSLRTSKLHKRMRIGAIAGAGVLTCCLAYWWYSSSAAESARNQLISEIESRLQVGDTVSAKAQLAAATDIDEETRGEIQRRIDAKVREELVAIAREKNDARRALMARAADHVDHGQLEAGLTIYADLLETRESRVEVQKVIRTRVGSLARNLHELASVLETMTPPAPDPLVQPESERREVLARLREKFRPEDLRRARGVLLARDSELLSELIGDAEKNKLIESAQRVVILHRGGETRKREYLALQSRTDTEKRLQPTFTAAETYLEKFQFREALAAYTKLADEYPAENDFKAHFRQQVERLEAILAALDTLDKATKNGDFAAARSQLQYLKASETDIPFDSLVQLPLQIKTVPSGATVHVNGREIGKSPLLCTYRPVGTKEIKLTLNGFRATTVAFEGDSRGSAEAILVKQPDWTFEAKGSIERAAAIDEQGRCFTVDRSGTLTALQLADGLPLWTHATRDMSGLVLTPIIWGDDVIVFTLDGAVTSLDRRSAEPSWKRFGIPCESTPTLAGKLLIAATTGGKLIGLDPSTGTPRFETQVPGPVNADLCSDGERVFLVTTNGWAVGANATTGRIQWKYRIGDAAVAAPLVAGPDRVVAMADSGRLACLDTKDGSVLWSQSGLGELLLTPALAGPRVVVADGMRLRTFAVADGTPGPGFHGRERWSTPPIAIDDKIMVGDRTGTVLVLTAEHLDIAFQIRGTAKISAPIAVTPNGEAVLGFEDRMVQAFRDLP